MSQYPKESHPIDVEAGRRLRHYREWRKISQDELGKRAGVTFQQIQKYELGQNRVSISRLCLIAEALNIHPFVLIPTPQKSFLMDEIIELITNYVDKIGTDTTIQHALWGVSGLSDTIDKP